MDVRNGLALERARDTGLAKRGRLGGERMTTVYAERLVPCPFSIAVELIERFHKATDHRFGPFPLVQLRVECVLAETPDKTDPARIHEALVLEWRVRGPFPFPRLRALITVRPQSTATKIRVVGSYVPPFGAAGRAFDVLIGRHIARRTIERLLDAVNLFIEREWEAERRRYETITAL